MRNVYSLDEIDCPNCASKLETAISKLKGVQYANINFFAQKLTLEAADSEFDKVIEAVAALVKKLEPDCEIIR